MICAIIFKGSIESAKSFYNEMISISYDLLFKHPTTYAWFRLPQHQLGLVLKEGEVLMSGVLVFTRAIMFPNWYAIATVRIWHDSSGHRYSKRATNTCRSYWTWVWRSVDLTDFDVSHRGPWCVVPMRKGMFSPWYDDVMAGNAWHITGLLWEETTGHRWIPLTKVR